MKKRMLSWLAIELLTCGAVARAGATTTVIYDHFDDGVLDPAWSIEFNQATGWSYTESGTTLNVTDVIGTEPGWICVNLFQYIAPLSDFNIDFRFSWDSESNLTAMQNVLVQAYNQTDKIMEAGYSDGWIASEGAKYGDIGGTFIDTGPDSMPASGTASVNINRTGNDIEIRWNGSLLLSGTNGDLIERVDLVFSHYVYDEGGTTSVFGNEAIDFIKVEGTTIPSPGALLLLAAGLVGLVCVRRKFGLS